MAMDTSEPCGSRHPAAWVCASSSVWKPGGLFGVPQQSCRLRKGSPWDACTLLQVRCHLLRKAALWVSHSWDLGKGSIVCIHFQPAKMDWGIVQRGFGGIRTWAPEREGRKTHVGVLSVRVMTCLCESHLQTTARWGSSVLPGGTQVRKHYNQLKQPRPREIAHGGPKVIKGWIPVSKKISSCAFLLKYNGEGRKHHRLWGTEQNIGDKHFGMLTDQTVTRTLQSVARQLSELIACELKINYYKIDFCTFYIHIISLNR